MGKPPFILQPPDIEDSKERAEAKRQLGGDHVGLKQAGKSDDSRDPSSGIPVEKLIRCV